MKQWKALGINSEEIHENDINWDLVKDKVSTLSLDNDGQIISLPDNMEYIQGKSACANFGSGKVEVLSRYIGFTLGSNTITIRVDEKTNNISVEVKDDTNHLLDSKPE